MRAADVGRAGAATAGTTNVFASGPQMPVIERDERELQADRDEHLLDVPRVERPDEHELDERREDAAETSPSSALSRNRQQRRVRRRRSTCTEVHHVP